MKIGEFLISEGLITQAQLDEGLAKQKETKGKLGEILLELGHIDPDAFTKVLEKQLQNA